MKIFLKNNKKVIILFIVLIIAFPTIILCPSPIGIIPKDIGIVIVGYGGAIIGGFLTLYGVWWTIEDNNAKRKNDLELQYSPVLSFDIVKKSCSNSYLGSEINLLFNHKEFNDADLRYSEYILKLRNVGRGEIQNMNIKIESCSIIDTNPHKLESEINLKAYILFGDRLNFIPINDERYICLGVPIVNKENSLLCHEKMYARINITFIVSIIGVFAKSEQNYHISFFVDVSLGNNLEDISLNTLTCERIEG